MWMEAAGWRRAGFTDLESIVMERRSLAYGVLHDLLNRRQIFKSRSLHRILRCTPEVARAIKQANLGELTEQALIRMTANAIHHHMDGQQHGTQT